MEQEPLGREAGAMSNVYLLVEGQTEATFVEEVLLPHYSRMGLYLWPRIIETSPGHKGGVATYGKIARDLDRLCKEHAKEHVSTMFDLYALPKDFPGKTSSRYPQHGNGKQKAEFLEVEFQKSIRCRNFIPNLLAHEFEALLFSRLDAFEYWLDDNDRLVPLRAIRETTEPEDINDHPDGAPSKRILKAIPYYEKPLHGPLIACDIGLDVIRTACPHFDGWLKKLERLILE